MKNLVKLAAAVTVPALMIATPASAVVPADSESYAIALSGTIDSNCELIPEGSGTFDVNMTDFGNQGSLVIAYSCNSPYTVSLESLNGGMRHVESGGAINIAYDVETIGFELGNGVSATSTNSTSMAGSAVDIVTVSDWTNIFLNGGIRTGNMDLNFPGVADSYVAGTYEDTLTITLAADL
ncbi:hypothetical protein [uncultured Parasphingorhabdus sp.]|uniref:hypothetical protein n=1 Tax=uncultured Parasphingorhabdus sp. TaxID=2709694 RepID=UPI0030D9AEAB|tara:strand:+ start:21799 stop:22341 length:543 start_codon:yes stop_codon:yes gene_type:complete